jgi:hypothetical protein
MATGAIIARILTQYSDKGSKAAQKDIATMGKKFDQFGKRAAASFAIAGAAAATFAIKFAKDSIRSATEAQASQNRLRTLLLNTNGATQEQIEALNQQAKALQRVGVVSADNVTVIQSQLATFDLAAKTIGQLTPAIVDYVTAEKGATASADQFKMMTNGLAQALNGNFGSLTRTGFVLDENTKKMISTGTETERAEAIVKVLDSTYRGFNKTLKGTTEGQLQAFDNAMKDLRQTVGVALLPVISKFVKLLEEKILPQLNAWIATNKTKLVASFEKAAEAFFKLLLVAIDFGVWASNNIGLIKNLAIAIASLWAIGKAITFYNLLLKITTAMQKFAAATALANAAGGTGIVGTGAKAAGKAGALGKVLGPVGVALAGGSMLGGLTGSFGNVTGKKVVDPNQSILNQMLFGTNFVDKNQKNNKFSGGKNPIASGSYLNFNGMNPSALGAFDDWADIQKQFEKLTKKSTAASKAELTARQKEYNLKLKALGITTTDQQDAITQFAIYKNQVKQQALGLTQTALNANATSVSAVSMSAEDAKAVLIEKIRAMNARIKDALAALQAELGMSKVSASSTPSIMNGRSDSAASGLQSFRQSESQYIINNNINGSLVSQDNLISTIIDGIQTTQARNNGFSYSRDR